MVYVGATIHLLAEHSPSPRSPEPGPGEGGAEDVALVVAAGGGDRASAAALYDRYSAYVHRLLVRVLGNDHESEDLLHEIFIEVFDGLGSLREPQAFRAWLTRITVNRARTRIRRRSRARWLVFRDPELLPEVPTAGSQVHREMLGRVFRHLARLDVDDRIAFLLRELDQMTLPEVASACGCSLATAKRRVTRARRHFEEMARRDAQLCDFLGGPGE